MTESSSQKKQFVLRLGDLRTPLDEGANFTIGKEDTCDLRLGHGTVSPIHCRLQVTADEIVVHDLNSLSGTKIDGEQVMDGSWRSGMILEVGEIRIELETRTLVATPLPVATAVTLAGVPGTGLVTHRAEAGFGEIMATELKRAPWFGLSVVFHAGILMLLWFFAERDVPLGKDPRVFSMEQSEEEDEIDESEIQEEVVVEKEMEDEEFNETEVEDTEEELFFDETDYESTDTGMGDIDDLMTNVAGAGLNDILKAGKSALSGKFKKTVAGLRKNGLEIVFVFDSTGSMGTVLQAAKDRIEKMVTVMIELVPYARIGVITFRDHDEGRDSYLMRKVALSRDFYRSMNFLQVVYAGGGGNEPEAVYDGLFEAIRKQKWGPTAKRMVILIGDAPPHKKSEGKIASMVKSFSHNGRSHVHAIITRPSGGADIAKTTQRTFRRIARDGRGEALEFEDEGKIMKAVMNLAFGRKNSRSVDEVYRLAEARRKRTSRKAERLLDPSKRKQLLAEFNKAVVSHDVIKAILAKPSRAVLELMVDIASKNTFKSAGKHAAAYILRRTLRSVEDPPVDPENGKSMSTHRARGIRKEIQRRFN